MSFIETIILFMIGGDLLCWWQGHYIVGGSSRARLWRTLIAAFFLLQLAGLALVIFSRNSGDHLNFLLNKPFVSAVFIWHLLLLVPVMVCTIAALLSAGALRLAKIFSSRESAVSAGDAPDRPRREFLLATCAAAPAAICFGLTGVALPQLERFRVRRFPVTLRSLPPELEGLTIAHVSDLHVGRFTSGHVLEEIVRATNDLQPDLVLLTGDLINHDLDDLPAALELVKAMRARHGVVMCEGNHDLIEDPRAFVSRTKASGVSLLVNESMIIPINGDSVQLLGLRWGGSRGPQSRAHARGDAAIATSLGELMRQRVSAAFPILLAHHPHAFDYAADLPLTLSGHTHGGQLMLSERIGFGPTMFRYWSGLYHAHDRALVVSNGVGNWFPLRMRAPAEIIHLTLKRI